MVKIPDRDAVVLVNLDGEPYAITGGSGGTSQQDSDPFTVESSSFTPVGGVYEATPTALTDGDGGAVGLNVNRALKVDATGQGDVPITLDGETVTVDLGANNDVVASGDVAHDAADSGNPVKTGGKASSSAPSNVAANDRVNQWYGLSGAPVMGAFGSAGADAESNTGGFLIGSDGNVRSLTVQPRLFNGTTWDRIRGDTTNGLDVDVTRLPSATIAGTTAATGSGTATGALRVELPTNGTGVLATVGTVTTVSTLTGTTTLTPGTGATNLGKAEDAAHATGDVGVMALGVRAASPTERSAGPTDGDYEPFATNEVGAVWASLAPSANGGSTVYHLVSGASTNAVVVKNGAGTLRGWYIQNTNAAMRKLAFHNASSTPTAGSSVYFSLPIPAGAAANVSFPDGIAFSTGISITTVTEAADSGTTAVGSGDLIINLFYK